MSEKDERLTITVEPADMKKLRRLAVPYDGNLSMTTRMIIREKYAAIAAQQTQTQEAEQA